MATASKTKKVSFKDKFASQQTTIWRGKMFNGEGAELEIRKITGIQELMAIREDVSNYGKRAKALQDKVDQMEAEGEDADLDEADMAIIYEGNALFGRMLKRVVVLPEGETMTEDDWTTLASNVGGLASPLWRVVAEATGLGVVNVESHDVPFSSAGSEA